MKYGQPGSEELTVEAQRHGNLEDWAARQEHAEALLRRALTTPPRRDRSTLAHLSGDEEKADDEPYLEVRFCSSLRRVE
jgi:hypothetical protein